MWELWFIMILLFLTISIWTNTLFFFGLTLSAFISLICSLFTYDLKPQCFLFIILSVFINGLILIMKWKPQKKMPGSLNQLIGKCGKVTASIGSSFLESGSIRLDGEIWHALSDSGTDIPAGSSIKVKAIHGLYLIVTPI